MFLFTGQKVAKPPAKPDKPAPAKTEPAKPAVPKVSMKIQSTKRIEPKRVLDPPPKQPSPPPKVEEPKPAAEKAKKSTSSRREELLKQLKAVEEAIARKRAKMQ